MLEHTPNAFYALDKDMRFLYSNKKIQELLRRSDEDLRGRFIWEVFPDWVNTSLYRTLSGALASGEMGHLEEYYKPLDRWFEVYVYPSDYGLAIYVNDVSSRKKSEQHLRILNQAGIILATEHDLAEALNRISTLIVPGFADWFTIDYLKDDGVNLLTMGHADPAKVRWGLDYRSRTKLDLEKPRPGSVGWVIRIGTPVLLNNVTDDMIKAAASDETHYAVLKELEINASIIVPMPMRGKTIGALTFISSRPEKVYDDADLDFAGDLATRVGLTIENSRMFEEMKKELAQKIRTHGIVA